MVLRPTSRPGIACGWPLRAAWHGRGPAWPRHAPRASRGPRRWRTRRNHGSSLSARRPPGRSGSAARTTLASPAAWQRRNSCEGGRPATATITGGSLEPTGSPPTSRSVQRARPGTPRDCGWSRLRILRRRRPGRRERRLGLECPCRDHAADRGRLVLEGPAPPARVNLVQVGTALERERRGASSRAGLVRRLAGFGRSTQAIAPAWLEAEPGRAVRLGRSGRSPRQGTESQGEVGVQDLRRAVFPGPVRALSWARSWGRPLRVVRWSPRREILDQRGRVTGVVGADLVESRR